jgi:hypothetical protein
MEAVLWLKPIFLSYERLSVYSLVVSRLDRDLAAPIKFHAIGDLTQPRRPDQIAWYDHNIMCMKSVADL